MRHRTGRIIATLGFIAAIGASVPAYAQVYWVVFAGKPTPVDCPSSPLGQTLTWVNQNCKQVARSVIDAGATVLSADAAGTMTRSR
jgi:hypothetical protein